MKAFRIPCILIFVMLWAVHVALPSQLASLDQPLGKVIGEVTDPRGYYIVDAEIIFEGAGRRCRVRTDSEGKYEAQLPAGTYRVKVERMGFRRFQRNDIRVEAGDSKAFNITLRFGKPIIVDDEHP